MPCWHHDGPECRLAAPQIDAAFPMSSLLSRARLRASLHYVSLPLPGDECETWTREQLLEMNACFVAALEQARDVVVLSH